MKRLEGKIALVTGAARGIGQGIATVFGELGATVIATDLNEAGLAETRKIISDAGGAVVTMAQDVSSEADWERMRAYINGEYGRLDALVNNAGIEMIQPIHELSLENWRKTMAVNVDGIFVGVKTLRDLLAASGKANPHGASIVNISSVAGLVGIPDQMAYNTSKAAVRHMTKSMTVEFYHHGLNIRANSIHPGVIMTPMMEEVIDEWQETQVLGTDDRRAITAFFEDVCPQKKTGTPRDIAFGAAYLASDEASFVTGVELVIDGGSMARW